MADCVGARFALQVLGSGHRQAVRFCLLVSGLWGSRLHVSTRLGPFWVLSGPKLGPPYPLGGFTSRMTH